MAEATAFWGFQVTLRSNFLILSFIKKLGKWETQGMKDLRGK
jgi:hypothetical protein